MDFRYMLINVQNICLNICISYTHQKLYFTEYYYFLFFKIQM